MYGFSGYDDLNDFFIYDNLLEGCDTGSIQESFSQLQGYADRRRDLSLHDSYHLYDGYPTAHSSTNVPTLGLQLESYPNEQYIQYYAGHRLNPQDVYSGSGSTVFPPQLHPSQTGYGPPTIPPGPPTSLSVNQVPSPSGCPSPCIASHSTTPHSSGTPIEHSDSTFTHPMRFHAVQSRHQPSHAAVAQSTIILQTPGRVLSMIPQRSYKPLRLTNRRQFGEIADLGESITFSVQNGTGIPVKDALEERFSGLDGRDDRMFVQNGTSVSLRFEWPGYEPWSRQIKTRDWRRVPRPITKAKLANEVAKKLHQFIKEMEQVKVDQDSIWRVGCGFIDVDRLVLVNLDHVSKGSWQPQFLLVN